MYSYVIRMHSYVLVCTRMLLVCYSYVLYIDIVFVYETWLNKSINNSEILHSGFTIIRHDRERRGEGVVLGVKTETFKSVREIENAYNLEIAMAEITTFSDLSIVFCSCYRPPDSDSSWMDGCF